MTRWTYERLFEVLQLHVALGVALELFLDGLGDRGKRVAFLLFPELVHSGQVVAFVLASDRTCGRIRGGNAQINTIELHVEQVVNEGLVSPSVVQRRGQIEASVEKNEEWTLEAELTHLVDNVVEEQAVSRVSQVIA